MSQLCRCPIRCLVAWVLVTVRLSSNQPWHPRSGIPAFLPVNLCQLLHKPLCTVIFNDILRPHMHICHCSLRQRWKHK